MSSKRSEIPDPAHSAAGVLAYQAGSAPFFRLQSLKANAPLPLVLLALVPLGWLVESRAFGPYNARIVMLVGFNVILAIGLQLINGFSGQFSLGHAGFMAVGAYLAAYPAITYSNNFKDPAAVVLYDGSLGVTLAVVGGLLYGLFWLIRVTRKLHPLLPAMLLMSALGWALADVAIASRYEVTPPYLPWSRAASGVAVAFDWVTSHGVGPAARLSALLPELLRGPACFLVLVAGGGAFAAATGLVVGLPTLRLRGDYLAIATLGMAEIIRIVIRNSAPLGGALGLTLIPRYTNFAWLYAAVVVSVVVVWRPCAKMKSPPPPSASTPPSRRCRRSWRARSSAGSPGRCLHCTSDRSLPITSACRSPSRSLSSSRSAAWGASAARSWRRSS
jgi:ABC-type branched-subunit amino acid transport system permease subunit